MLNDTLRVIANFRARPGCEDELRTLLLGLIEPTRAEHGCIQYDLLHGSQDAARFTFVEAWTDDAALDAHLASAHIAAAVERLPELVDGEVEILRCRQVG